MAIDRETQVLNDAAAAGITSPKELANFMAQVTHESNGLNRLEESFRYTRDISQIPVQSAWREGPQVLDAARKQALQGKPEHLAELMYGGRNGNDEPGDGWKYHGRGYIQLTGKDNYRSAGEALNLDLVKNPELAADPKNASKIATWYWENRVPENAREDVKAATKAINGKYNGLEDREERFGQWQKKLTPEVMERLDKSPRSEQPDAPRGVMKEGMHGEDVRMLQANLARLGYKDGAGNTLHTDGKFGPGTEAALKSFQRDHHLAADGVAGPRSLAAIEQQKHVDATRHTPASPRLDDKAHPDNGMYTQALNAVHRLDAQHGRTPDQQSSQFAGSLTASAKAQGLNRIDSVVLSDDTKRAYAVQGDMNSPHKKVAEVETQKAVSTPLEQSSAAAINAPSHTEAQKQQTRQPQGPSMPGVP
jgi:putative chitinase